mmetsp:Transcript_9117/g.37605  ORF Transcript_9117/g.37605 Transcript_9117/m.37605 type:complete len:235 (+) Transcript_9117:75-779(+)
MLSFPRQELKGERENRRANPRQRGGGLCGGGRRGPGMAARNVCSAAVPRAGARGGHLAQPRRLPGAVRGGGGQDPQLPPPHLRRRRAGRPLPQGAPLRRGRAQRPPPHGELVYGGGRGGGGGGVGGGRAGPDDVLRPALPGHVRAPRRPRRPGPARAQRIHCAHGGGALGGPPPRQGHRNAVLRRRRRPGWHAQREEGVLRQGNDSVALGGGAGGLRQGAGAAHAHRHGGLGPA